MKCERCGYDDNGTGDTAHACSMKARPTFTQQAALDERQRLVERVSDLETKNGELLRALQDVRLWFEAERKSISKGNGSQWAMWQCEEQIEAIDAAIGKLGRQSVSVKANLSTAQSIADQHERCKGLVPPCKFDCVCQFEAENGIRPTACSAAAPKEPTGGPEDGKE